MIAVPCWMGVRTSQREDDADCDEPEELVYAADAVGAEPAYSPGSLQEMLVEAEGKMIVAREFARQAHWNAVAAEARVAALRADVAAEVAALAGQVAEEAIRAAEAQFDGEYLPPSDPSLDSPRSRMRRRAA